MLSCSTTQPQPNVLLQNPRTQERRIPSWLENFIIFVVVAAVIIVAIPVINLPIIEIDLTLLGNLINEIIALDLQAVLPEGKGENSIIQIAGTLLLTILLLL